MAKKITAALLVIGLALAAAAPFARAEMSDEELRSWFSCEKCKAFTEIVGFATLAAIIFANPTSSAAAVAYQTVYYEMEKEYGSPGMDLDRFIERSKTFLSPLSAAEFVIHYPRFCCCLWGKCSCSGECDCAN